ncbi:thioredoxin domain-containing protein [Sanguibacter suaedae]|uniref:Thioredoxin domain-containing protein n=1 Tax=Sanguibacter suaedae TaxID=2795737 RepID=A0A934I1M3_9MICO|nr:thioredoxin domain-containing protein [Sanguibacter suaedae]MBI9113538.1 thioredoxin domain-containing protein [Sanguibacter suaedae]
MNRLSRSLSPYLRQHADNPVDWREWSSDAFAEARERDVPVLLSVGYAACHWCHVMAHESFEDEATAAQMNAGFVNVKVDREERPDIDSVYMAAVVAMTRQGGWPMTVFLTPDGAPFFAGTYYPPTPVQGMPSFRQVLDAVSTAWRDRREDIVEQAGGLVEHLRTQSPELSTLTSAPTVDDLAGAVDALSRDLDAQHGGFGGAPKFPPSMTLEQLLRHHARTGDERALRMVLSTCEAMARGGLYDQLGGGFARYSVDAGWVVPHFEKMLYDNAQLLGVYAHLTRTLDALVGGGATELDGQDLVGPAALARRVTTETAEFLLRELRTGEGAFASSLDADSDGHEGTFYVWTPEQLVDVLGEDDGRWAARVLSVTPEGTFEGGASVLQLLDPDLVSAPDDAARWERVRTVLAEAREQRTRPGRDDKVVAGWNGMAVGALAEAGMILGRPDWVDAAEEAAGHVVALHLGTEDHAVHLRRVSLGTEQGDAGGTLEDYALLADGLLVLSSARRDTRWTEIARHLLDTVLDRFIEESPEGGTTFYDTPDAAHDGVELVVRPADPGDNASPSGRSAAAGALLRYAALSGSHRHRQAAEAALAVYPVLARRAPRFAGHALAVAEAMADGPREVAVVLPTAPGSSAGDDLVQAAWATPTAGAVIAVGPEGTGHPLLADRPAPVPTAYVCRGFVCERPVTTAADLRQLLSPTRTTEDTP